MGVIVKSEEVHVGNADDDKRVGSGLRGAVLGARTHTQH